jgi:hypothetical protein
MRIIYAYNPHDAKETTLLDRVKEEISEVSATLIDELMVEDFQIFKKYYPISQTPALIIVREDLQGHELLEEDEETGSLRLIAKVTEELQKETAARSAAESEQT